jgi:hypothetical protein
MRPTLYLGAERPLEGSKARDLHVPVDDLATHGVVVGMTGSGKSGVVMVLIEEALRAGVPVLVFDVKGDLPNLLLAFPDLSPRHFLPWTAAYAPANDPRSSTELAQALAEERRKGLAAWKLGEPELRAYHARTQFRVITPGGSAGERLHILSGLERHTGRWEQDPESLTSALPTHPVRT